MQIILKPKYFLLMLLALAACKTQSSHTSKHKQRPQSPVVKKISKFVGTGQANTLVQEEEFDSEGNKTRLIKYNIDGKSAEFVVTYTTDNEGNIIKSETKYADGVIETEEHELNSEGKTIKTIWKRSDGAEGRHEYKYDKRDSIIQWDWYEKDKFIISRLYPYVYDDDDRLIESYYKETKNNRDTNTVNSWTYDYDSSGRLVRKLSFFEGQPSGMQQFMYDSFDNPIIELVYVTDSMESGTLALSKRQINEFNEYGEIITSRITKDTGDVHLTIYRRYDDFGHLLEIVYDHANGTREVERYKYELYDDKRVRE